MVYSSHSFRLKFTKTSARLAAFWATDVLMILTSFRIQATPAGLHSAGTSFLNPNKFPPGNRKEGEEKEIAPLFSV